MHLKGVDDRMSSENARVGSSKLSRAKVFGSRREINI